MILVGIGSHSVFAADSAGALPEIEYGYPEQRPRAYTNEKGEFDGHYQKLLAVLFNKAGMS